MSGTKPEASRTLLALPVADANGASTRYRVLAHVPALSAAGFRVDVRHPLAPSRRGGTRVVRRLADLVRDVALSRGPDLVWIHRKMYPPVFARRLAATGRPLVLDLDDAVDLPPPDRDCGPRVRRRYRRNFEATANRADLVLCGNREIGARLPHDRFEIVPTPIDTARFAPERLGPARAKVVGWVGHSSNLTYLEALAEPLREVARRHPGLVLRVVCDRPPALPGLTVDFQPWSLDREVRCFEGLSVGLMPLPDTPWARCKCAFKAIQYMALGIPAVVSPVGMNRDVVRHGHNGLLAVTDEEWAEGLDRLLSEPTWAAGLAEAARRTIVEQYSLDAVSRRLVAILLDIAPGA